MKGYHGKTRAAAREYWFLFLLVAEWCAIYLLQLRRGQLAILYPDSSGYDNFSLSVFVHSFPGKVPLYPLFMLLLRTIFGQWHLVAAVVLQSALCLLSVACFYKTLLLLKVSQRLAVLFALLYGGSSTICGWNYCILTESLSLSGMVVLFWFVVRFIRFERQKDGLACIGICFLLVFLRPQFLLHYVILACYFGMKYFFSTPQIKAVCRRLLLILCGGGFLILGYCALFYNTYKIFSLATSKVIQDLYVCMGQGLYKNYPDADVVADIDRALAEAAEQKLGPDLVWGAIGLLDNETYPLARCQEITRTSMAASLPAYLRYLFFTIKEWRKVQFWGYGGPLTPADLWRVEHVLFISLMQGLAMVVLWVRRRYPPWVHMGLFAFTFSTAWSTFLVTNAEFSRTMISTIPTAMISVALFLQWASARQAPPAQGGEGKAEIANDR